MPRCSASRYNPLNGRGEERTESDMIYDRSHSVSSLQHEQLQVYKAVRDVKTSTLNSGMMLQSGRLPRLCAKSIRLYLNSGIIAAV